MRAAAASVMRATARHARCALNILVVYSGQDEILMAAERASKAGARRPTGKALERFLWVKNPVDLVIMTGKERRMSNFLPYQTAYAEVVFIDKYWPDFTRGDLRRAMREYERRERRMGA